MPKIYKMLSCLCLAVLISGCGVQVKVPDEITQKAQIIADDLAQKSTQIKDRIITTIDDIQVSALPYIAGIEENLEQLSKDFSFLQAGGDTQDKIIECLQKKGVRYYTSASCAFAHQQRTYLAEDLDAFDRIYCDADKDLIACKVAGVQGTPARGIPDKTPLHGIQTKQELAQAFGCE